MKILVTGDAGNIGSSVLLYPRQNTQHQVINLEKLTYAGNIAQLPGASDHPRYKLERADIYGSFALTRVPTGHRSDAVMHLSAESHFERSTDAPTGFYSKISGTYIFPEVCRHNRNNQAVNARARLRFHHISTYGVYRDLKDSEALLTQQTPHFSSVRHSTSKTCSDHLAHPRLKTYRLPRQISNSSSPPNHFPEELRPVYGDGSQACDWLHIEDHAPALLKAPNHGQPGATFNTGGHHKQRNLEVVEDLYAPLDGLAPEKPADIQRFAERITCAQNRPDHYRRDAVDAEPGWRPQAFLKSGPHKTVRWYLQSHSWWQDALDDSYQIGRPGPTPA